MNFIKPSLVKPGQEFTVTEFVKDASYGISSKGYVSIICGKHETYQNIAKIIAIMTRKGKSGKPRLEKIELAVPIFIYFENEENFHKLMPTINDVRHYAGIEANDTGETNADLLKEPTIDFIGWASSMITYLHHISSRARYGTWPEDQAHPLNRFRRMPDIYNDDRERIESTYNEKKNRSNVIDNIRRVEASLFKLRLGNQFNFQDIITNAAEFLVYANTGEFIPPEQEDKTNEFRFTENQELLDENLKYHKEVYADLSKMCSEKKIPML